MNLTPGDRVACYGNNGLSEEELGSFFRGNRGTVMDLNSTGDEITVKMDKDGARFTFHAKQLRRLKLKSKDSAPLTGAASRFLAERY